MSIGIENPNIVEDAFLSEQLQKRTYRLRIDSGWDEELAAALAEIQSHDVFIYCKIGEQSSDVKSQIEKLGFELVDTQLTLEKDATSSNLDSWKNEIRMATADDEEQTVAVARRAFQYSRFHADDKVSQDAADRVKAEWVRNYFKGQRGCAMVLGIVNGRVAGFIQLLRVEQTLVIDLIAVDQSARKQGLASEMIHYAECKCLEDCHKVRVGTQSDNEPSLALYDKLGFKLVFKDFVYHYHK